MARTFQCTLVTPERQLLDEQVTYASIPAVDGQIGVMPGRAPLLVKLGDGPLRLEVSKEGGSSNDRAQQFFVGGGFAQMKGNVLSLVASEAMPVVDMDPKAAETALKQAQSQVTRDDDEFTKNQREQVRARTILKLTPR